jgi:flagellin-like protein
MKRMLKSKEGISPILATLLLIVIAVAAVIVTYAWVMTFTSSTTGQAGAVLSVENVRYYNSSGLKVDITIRNSGTADAKVATVYQGTSSSNLQTVSSVTYDPTTQMVNTGSSLKMTFALDWQDGTRYYFKVVTEAAQELPFSEEA